MCAHGVFYQGTPVTEGMSQMWSIYMLVFNLASDFDLEYCWM